MSQSKNRIYLRGINIDDINPDDKVQKIIIGKKKEKPTIPLKYDFTVKTINRKHIIINNILLKDGFNTKPLEKSNGNLRCMYTLEPIEDYPIGIPVAKREVDGKTSFYCIDVFGTFNDALAECIKRRQTLRGKKLYENSEIFLHEMFKKYYPNDELLPSADNRCLKIFNGNMEISEFRKFSYEISEPDVSYSMVPMINNLNYIQK